MSRPHDLLVDPVEDVRGEQPQVVLDRLQLVADVVLPVANPQHLAQGGVLVGQLVEAVVIGVEAQTQHPEHEDRPLRHAGPPRVRAGLALRPHPFGAHLFEDGEDALAQFGVEVEVLQPAQDLRDIVAGLGVEDDGGDVGLAERQLGIDDLAHGIRGAKIFKGRPSVARQRTVSLGKNGVGSAKLSVAGLDEALHSCPRWHYKLLLFDEI